MSTSKKHSIEERAALQMMELLASDDEDDELLQGGPTFSTKKAKLSSSEAMWDNQKKVIPTPDSEPKNDAKINQRGEHVKYTVASQSISQSAWKCGLVVVICGVMMCAC